MKKIENISVIAIYLASIITLSFTIISNQRLIKSNQDNLKATLLLIRLEMGQLTTQEDLKIYFGH